MRKLWSMAQLEFGKEDGLFVETARSAMNASRLENVAAGAFIGFFAALVLIGVSFSGRRSQALQTVDAKVLEAYSLLQSTQVGRALTKDVPRKNIQMEVVPLKDALATWSVSGPQGLPTISINPDLMVPSVSAEILAGILAHEYTHAGQERWGLPYSLDKEMESEINQVLVWRSLLPDAALVKGRWTGARVAAFLSGKHAVEAFVTSAHKNRPVRWMKDIPNGLSADHARYRRALEEKYARIWDKHDLLQPAFWGSQDRLERPFPWRHRTGPQKKIPQPTDDWASPIL